MTRTLELFCEGRTLRVDKKNLAALIAALDAHYQPKNRGSLSIALISHKHLAALHAEFCGDPAPTDVITFPAAEEDAFGEICISPQAAVEYVKKHGGKVEAELRRYVIHGYLHLLGFDDLKPKLKQQMRREEKRCLELAKGIKNIFTLRA